MASSTWKRDFASGLIVLLPILVTLYILWWLYRRLADIPMPVDPPLSVVLTLTLFILMVFSFGYLMRTTIGELFERILDDLMNQLPGLRVVYNASKMAVETAVSGTDELQTPVRLEPWEGMRMTAFKTGKQTNDGRDIIFLPTAPNITSGYVIEVEPDDYEELDERVEDALTRILSAGFGDTDDDDIPAMALGVDGEGAKRDGTDD